MCSLSLGVVFLKFSKLFDYWQKGVLSDHSEKPFRTIWNRPFWRKGRTFHWGHTIIPGEVIRIAICSRQPNWSQLKAHRDGHLNFLSDCQCGWPFSSAVEIFGVQLVFNEHCSLAAVLMKHDRRKSLKHSDRSPAGTVLHKNSPERNGHASHSRNSAGSKVTKCGYKIIYGFNFGFLNTKRPTSSGSLIINERKIIGRCNLLRTRE